MCDVALYKAMVSIKQGERVRAQPWISERGDPFFGTVVAVYEWGYKMQTDDGRRVELLRGEVAPAWLYE